MLRKTTRNFTLTRVDRNNNRPLPPAETEGFATTQCAAKHTAIGLWLKGNARPKQLPIQSGVPGVESIPRQPPTCNTPADGVVWLGCVNRIHSAAESKRQPGTPAHQAPAAAAALVTCSLHSPTDTAVTTTQLTPCPAFPALPWSPHQWPAVCGV